MLTGKEFASCWIKIARANDHLNALKDEMLAWKATRPYAAKRSHDETGYRHSITIHIGNPPPLERWSVISGDCVHALRCALDHFAYAVAVHQSKLNPPPDERVLQFPIADTPEKFAVAVRRIRALGERMQRNIEAVQPYRRPHTHVPPLLGLLRDLDDADKHRLLNVVVSRQAQGRISFTAVSPALPVIPTSISYKTGAVADGAEIVWFTVDPPNTGLQYEHETVMVIALSHSPGPSGETLTEVVPVLDWLAAEVATVIQLLATAT